MSAPATLPVTTLDEALAEIARLRQLERLAERWARLRRLAHPRETMDSPPSLERVVTRADFRAAERELAAFVEANARGTRE